MPLVVTLSLPEMSLALDAAWLRIVTSAAKGLNHAATYQRSMTKRIQEEFVGACGEIAVGKAADKFFVPSVNTFHRVPDCLGDCEVRCTEVSAGRLIVRDNDSDTRKYVLGVMVNDTITLVGWILGADAKRDEWIDNPNNYRTAWFVPQNALNPIEELLSCHANQASLPRLFG